MFFFILNTIELLITLFPVFFSFNYHSFITFSLRIIFFNYTFLYVLFSANYHAAVAYKVQANMVFRYWPGRESDTYYVDTIAKSTTLILPFATEYG